MNNLSWLIYWADVLPSLSIFLGVILFLASALFFGFSWYFLSWKDELYDAHRDPPVPTENARRAKSLFWAPYATALCLIAWGLTFFVPSKDTFYLIAASEMGEQVIATPEAAKLRAILNDWLDEQIRKGNEDANQQNQ